jgi:hypothetical protein
MTKPFMSGRIAVMAAKLYPSARCHAMLALHHGAVTIDELGVLIL